MNKRLLQQAAKELAAKGGRSASGTAKRRPRAHYVRAGKLSAKARRKKAKPYVELLMPSTPENERLMRKGGKWRKMAGHAPYNY